MNIGNLQSAAGRLQEALDELERAWQRTIDEWADENSQRIEQDHLARLAHEVRAVLPAISQMSQSLQQAARECNE
jgi:hypothetical protein